MLPYITHELPGIGGMLRCEPQDFAVREIPSYAPSGQGEHLMVEVTKRDMTTQQAVSAMAELLGIDSGEIGYAGLKDRRAVTVQHMTLPAGSPVDKLPLWQEEGSEPRFGVKVLDLHDNKIRRGHLSGNVFTLRLRRTNLHGDELKAVIRDIQQALQERGFANFYGPQRFGRTGNNARIGEKGVRSGRLFGPKWKRWLMVSAFQSELFNRYLAERIRDGLFSKALKGDIFGRLPKGGVFLSQDPSAEQPRMDSFEISPMGPIFGAKMMKTKDEAAEREADLLSRACLCTYPEEKDKEQCLQAEASGQSTSTALALEDFKRVKAMGSRRRFRLSCADLEVTYCDGDPVFHFELPSGSYATVFLNEFMKTDLAPANPEDEEDAEDD